MRILTREASSESEHYTGGVQREQEHTIAVFARDPSLRLKNGCGQVDAWNDHSGTAQCRRDAVPPRSQEAA